MKYGKELIEELKDEIARNREIIKNRIERIEALQTDWDDCFVSQRFDDRAIRLAKDKIELIEAGGVSDFLEYATTDGKLVKARWRATKYGTKLRAELPDGSVIWTEARTAKGLAKYGLKKVLCTRPAWYRFSAAGSGLAGAYFGNYVLFPSDYNYATGEAATAEPLAIKEV